MEFKEKVISKLKEQFSDVEFEITEFRGELCLKFEKSRIVDICRYLKDDQELKFIHCEDLTAIDWATRKNRFTMVYLIFSLENKFRVKLKCDVEEKDCVVDSVTSVWMNADWAEREVYDMYGISFNDHPDLRRMYMPDDFEYYPLRKDFPLMGIPGSLSLPKKTTE